MSYENARAHLARCGFEDRIQLFDVSSATVELAAAALGTEPGRIAKSLTFDVPDGPVMILFAGDARVSNPKFKHTFGAKAKMLPAAVVAEAVGHDVGGVCPFGVNDGVRVYLDVSLRAYDTVYPAAGSANSAVRLSPDELERACESLGWVDVSK